jgi:ABC-type transport system involved in multi-copper enzyme maturation permease subunit
MIGEFFRFELREQLRSPLPWLLAGLFALLAFGAGASDAVTVGGAIGNVHRNAPTVIASFLGVFTLLGMLIVALFASGALLRDFEQGTAELVFACPVRKRDFLVGRLAAAMLASVLVYVVIAAGLFIAQFMPWIDEARLGPVSLVPYLWSFGVLVLPNVLFTCALLALLATLTRGILWVYIGVLAFFVLYTVSVVLLRDVDNVWAGVLADPLGIRALSRTTRYWSSEERNSGVPSIAGYLIANRALWTAISLGLLAATFASFRTDRTGTGKRWFGRKAKAPAPVETALAPALRPLSVPRVAPRVGAGVTARQFVRLVRFDTAGVFRGVPFLVLLAFGLVNFIPSALMAQSLYGTPIHPVTSQMVAALEGSYSFLLPIIVMFYAGELVWKERGAKIAEISDALPMPDWVSMAAKLVSLFAVIVAFQALGATMAMAIQLAKGGVPLEPLLYAKMLAVDSVFFVLAAVLALVLQVFTNSKFAGFALLMLFLLGRVVLGALDFNHPLYAFGEWSNAPHSDMNGYGHFLPTQLWEQGYWAAMFAAGLVLAAAFWVRGTAGTRAERWAKARVKLRGPMGVALAGTVAAWLAIGGWLYWNLDVRNTYTTGDERLDLQARYEKEYKQYESLPQPRIVAADIGVDLRPETQAVDVDGTLRMRNPGTAPIPEVHLVLEDDDALEAIDFGGQTLVTHDEPLGYRIYRLAKPLAPGEERTVTFRLGLAPNGIASGAPDTRIVDNGTFFNSRLFPSFGYYTGAEITDRNERRKRGLGEPRRMPKLEDEEARANNYVTPDADWIDFRTTVCTAPDQTALAPGYLKREFMKDGRRCFRYEMDRPMLNFYAYLSARWQVARGEYRRKDGSVVPIEVYHDPGHAWNVQRMIEATQASLDYYESEFTPYQHQQVRIVEFPGYASFAQSFANTIPYSESIGFIADLSDPDEVDYVYYVTAHEVAHQWWAHQVIGANVQGATVLSESLAQYSALMVMEKEYGRAQMRQFLKTELDGYLSGRGGELIEEEPLFRVENQQYIHYEKGSLVFYRLREEIGEAALNRALKGFLQDKGFQNPPYTTSRELLSYIRAEARPEQQALITDLFEKIAFYDNRIEAATAKKRADGRYEVTLDLHAEKRYADGVGKETPGTLDDWIEVGVFAKGPSGKERDEKVLYLQRHRITQAEPTITVVVDAAPDEAGFDPYNKLIDRVSSDNRRDVSL